LERAWFSEVMVQCVVTRYHVEKHRKPVVENRSRFDRHMARRLVWDTLLAFLHHDSHHDAVFSVFLYLRASRVQQYDQPDGRFGSHSGLQPNVIEVDQPLV